MALPPNEFLQHVLPQGLHRVRGYGLFSSAHRITLQRIRLLLRAPDVDADDNDHAAAEPKWKCPNCDGVLNMFPKVQHHGSRLHNEF